LVLAARSASFIQSFNKLGLVPDSGGTWILPKLVGHAKAMRLCLLGEKVPAQEALDMGMICQVCEDDSLRDEALELGRQLAIAPTKGLGLIKRALQQSQSQGIAGRSDDYREGVAAFMDKRAPNYKGS